VVMAINKDKLLHGAQYAGVKGGSTGDPLFIRRAVVESCKEKGEELHIFDSDISKAYDSVHFWSIEQALQRIGLPALTIKLMLNIQGGKSKVLNGGVATEGYEVEKGVRQGEVLSPFLWVVFTDALLCAQQEVGLGVKIGDVEGYECHTFGSSYMDDAVWYSNGKDEMQRRVEVQSAFCKYHGIKLNMNKSTYTVVPKKGGRSAHVPQALEVGGVQSKIGHAEGYFKYLGIMMSPVGNLRHEVGKLEAWVEGVYKSMHRQNLTTAERVYIINTVVAGKLQYTMQTTGLPRAKHESIMKATMSKT
jgi:hypothetical protein